MRDGSGSEDRRGCWSPWTALMGGPTHPHARGHPRINSTAGLLLTIPCRLLSLTRSPFRPLPVPVLFRDRECSPWAPDVAAGQVPDTPVTGGPSMVVGHRR